MKRKSFIAVGLALVLAGCGDSYDQMAAYLPPGTALTDPVIDDGPKKSPETTVRDKLVELHASIGQDRKLHDQFGREIYFWCRTPGGGPPIPPKEAQRRDQERKNRLAALREHFTVIVVKYTGEPVP